LASNQTIEFAAGVEVESDTNWNPGSGDDLFSGNSLVNVNFEGDASDPATIELLNPPSPPGVFQRHCLALDACQNFTISDLKFKSISGDGMYLGGVYLPCTSITIENCTTYECARCGLGVINCEQLDVEDCVFKDGGNNPNEHGWGVDIEPNYTYQKLVDLNFLDCEASNNNKSAFRVWIAKLDTSSTPVDVVFTNCDVERNTGHAYFVNYLGDPEDCPSGKVEFKYCDAMTVQSAGAVVNLPSENPMLVEFDQCTWTDVGRNTSIPEMRPIGIYTTTDYQSALSGIDFLDCVLYDDKNREFAWVNGFAPGSYEDVEGTIVVHNPNVKTMPPGVLLPNLTVRYLP
jgi:hypothetical protein